VSIQVKKNYFPHLVSSISPLSAGRDRQLRLPATIGEQFGDPAVRVRAYPIEHVAEVGEWVDARFLGRSRTGRPALAAPGLILTRSAAELPRRKEV
jgi:hypothetical protein